MFWPDVSLCEVSDPLKQEFLTVMSCHMSAENMNPDPLQNQTMFLTPDLFLKLFSVFLTRWWIWNGKNKAFIPMHKKKKNWWIMSFSLFLPKFCSLYAITHFRQLKRVLNTAWQVLNTTYQSLTALSITYNYWKLMSHWVGWSCSVCWKLSLINK